MTGILVAWVVSHFIGIGEIVDIILLVLGVFAIGLAIFEGLDELYMFDDKALNAQSEKHLDQSGKHFANAVAILGIQAVLAVLFREAPKTFKGKRPAVGQAPKGGNALKSIKRDATLPASHGKTSWWGEITISPHGTAADRRLAAMHEKVHQILTPKLDVLRAFRVRGRAASYNKSSLSKYLEEAVAEEGGQLGVNGFKAAFDQHRPWQPPVSAELISHRGRARWIVRSNTGQRGSGTLVVIDDKTQEIVEVQTQPR